MTTPLNNGTSYLPSAGEGTVATWTGTYAATVVNNDDPLGVGRLQLNIPMVLGNSVSTWAIPLGNYFSIPTIGTTVSACFIGGDPSQPAWIGPLDLAPLINAGATKTTYSTSQPANPVVGDVWYPITLGTPNTVGAPEVWTFNSGTSSFSWVVQPSLGSGGIAAGAVGPTQLASSVTARALGGVTTTLGSTPPLTGNLPGDLFINSTTGQIQQYNGTSWTPITFTGSTVIQAGTITGATIAASTISGNNILAGTITARNLNVGDSLNPNPYFGGGDTSSWTAFATSGTTPAFSSVATTGGFGYPWAGQISAVAGSAFPGISGTSFAVNSGDPVQVNGWFNTNANLQFTISYYNSGGGFLSQTVVNVGASAGNWQYAAITGNVFTGAVKASLTVKINTGSAAGTEVFQATGLTVISKLSGGIIEAGTITAAQIQAGTITANELAVTGSGVTNFNPYFAGGSTANWTVFAGTLTGSTSIPSGNNYYNSAGKVTSDASQAYTGVSGNTFSCTPGNGVNLSAYVYATQTNMSLQVQWYTSSFGFISQTFLSTPVTVNTWTYVTWTATPPATAAIGIPIWQMNKSTAGNLANTDFFWVTGAYVLSSFDGGIINAGTINTAQLNANAINGMTITGVQIFGGTITSSSSIQNSNGTFFYSTTPPIPTVTPASTGGTIPAATYHTEVTYTNSTGETTPSLSVSTGTSGSTSTLTVTSPPAAGNATGYNVYMNTSGTFFKQNSSPIAIGTNYVRTTPIATSGTAAPTTATGVVNIAQNGGLIGSITSAAGTDAYSNAYSAGITSYQFGGISTTQLNGGIVTFNGGATIAGLQGGPAGLLVGGGSATYLQTNVPWTAPLTVAHPVSVNTAETWQTMTLANSWTVGSGGIAQYRLNIDNTVTVQCTNLVPGTTTSGTSIWAIPSSYQSAQTVTQNFPVIIVESTTTAPTNWNTPFVAVRGTGTNTLTVQNLPTAGTITGLSFTIRYSLV